MSNPREPIPLRDAVAEVGRDLGMPAPDALGALNAAWPTVVGDAIAAHASIRSVRDGVCTIVVDDPAWATELRYRSEQLTEALSRAAGSAVVTSIRVVVSPG